MYSGMFLYGALTHRGRSKEHFTVLETSGSKLPPGLLLVTLAGKGFQVHTEHVTELIEVARTGDSLIDGDQSSFDEASE